MIKLFKLLILLNLVFFNFLGFAGSSSELLQVVADLNYMMDHPNTSNHKYWVKLNEALQRYQDLKNHGDNTDLSSINQKLVDFYSDFFPKSNTSTPERIKASTVAIKLMQKIKALSKHINSPGTRRLLRDLGLNDPIIIDTEHVQERHIDDGTLATVSTPEGISGSQRVFKKFGKSITGIKTIFPKGVTQRDVYKIIEGFNRDNFSSDYDVLEKKVEDPAAQDKYVVKYLIRYKPLNLMVEFIRDGSTIKTAYPVIHYEDISQYSRDYILSLNWKLIDVLDQGDYYIPLSKDGILEYFSKNKFNPIYQKGNLIVVNVTPIIIKKNPDLKGKVPPVYVKIDKTEIGARQLPGPSPLKRKVPLTASPSTASKLIASVSVNDSLPKKLFN